MSSTTISSTAMNSATDSATGSAPPPPPPPPLSFAVALAPDQRRETLRLVADSIAQQRQVAALAVIFHPLCLVVLVAGCAVSWRHSAPDLGSGLVAVCGLVMAYLAAVRLYTAPFLRLAERFDCASFLAGPGGVDDLVVVARFGDEIIGALVLRLQAPAGDAPGRGLIRAWTTTLRYRGKGIGADLLRYAVAATRARCGAGASVAFDPDHANASFPLSRLFRRPFTARDDKATKALEHALGDCDANQGGFSPFQEKRDNTGHNGAVRKRAML